MFEVLVFVYENYYAGDSYPEPAALQRKLNAVGFEPEEIGEAVAWLNGLNVAARGTQRLAGTGLVTGPGTWLREPQPTSTRIYSSFEQRQLGSRGLGYIAFLESAGALSAPMREVVVDRVLATSSGRISILDLKTIVLMVFWSFGVDPGQLLMEELCDDDSERLAN